jgi:hypothetical protein
MPDMDAIAVALALRFDPAAALPPAGYDPIRLSTGDLPGQMTPLPTVLVFPSSGSIGYPAAGDRAGEHVFLVRFYYSQTGDLERDMVALRRWLTVLLDRLLGAVQLAGVVHLAQIVGWTIGVFPYAGQEYTGIELAVSIGTNDHYTPIS